MKRFLLGLSIVAIAIALHPFYRSADSVAFPGGDPLVGSWRLIDDQPNVNATFLFTFFPDGIAMATDKEGLTWHGAWKSVSPVSVALTMESLNADSSGQGFSAVIEIGTGPDAFRLMGGTLQRIVAEDGSSYSLASPTT